MNSIDREGLTRSPMPPCGTGTVPADQSDPAHAYLRVTGMGESAAIASIAPDILTLSSSANANGSVAVSGTTTLNQGQVEAFSSGTWKSIGDVRNGAFFNDGVPRHYLLNADTMRIRVRSLTDEAMSQEVDSTLGFPHSRSMLFDPKQSGADDQARFRWRMRKADYQPTGYFAPAGRQIEVWATGNMDDVTLLVGTQGLADRNDPRQQSPSMRATRLLRGRNLITDPHGGIIHVRSLLGENDGPTRIVLGPGAIPIAYYVHGVTSALQWWYMLNTTTMPEVQWVGSHVVIAAFHATVLKFAAIPPGTSVHHHERVLQLQAEIAGFDGSSPLHSRTNLLIYAVEGPASAPPHATTGYIALPHANDDYMKALLGGQAAKLWVTLHEYGHHYQDAVNSTNPFGEVSVNLYSLEVARFERNEYTTELPGRWPEMRQWLARPRDEKDFGSAPDPMCIFEQLRLGLGKSFLASWARYIRETPGQTRPGLLGFVVSACSSSGYDLGNFFADWGLLKPEHADIWQAVEALRLPKPPVQLTAVQPYTDLAL